MIEADLYLQGLKIKVKNWDMEMLVKEVVKMNKVMKVIMLREEGKMIGSIKIGKEEIEVEISGRYKGLFKLDGRKIMERNWK